MCVVSPFFYLSTLFLVFFFLFFLTVVAMFKGWSDQFGVWVAVGWLDRAAQWWRKLEIDFDCVDDQRGGGEIGLGFALIFCYGYSVYLQVHGGGGGGLLWWWWRWVH